jgi:hypothetical protein
VRLRVHHVQDGQDPGVGGRPGRGGRVEPEAGQVVEHGAVAVPALVAMGGNVILTLPRIFH